ncbi:MAG: hypothetical protein COS95_05960 [Ignavibacteriales bacterium CG07_land_8_20_14_0_80_59_12]|nr:MAG: hypothetical protein COS95_05960 [Ignavibacteriales bacterium CG07_land_8_20_14_0_80_59_12]
MEQIMAEKQDLLTAGKLAQLWNVPPAQVKKAIKASGAKADVVKGRCSYFGPKTSEKIHKALGK